MTRNEALNILDLDNNFTKDDLNKKFKSLAKTNHPDVFTDPDKKKVAEEKYKKISEAYEFLKSDKKDPINPINFNFNDLQDFLSSTFHPYGHVNRKSLPIKPLMVPQLEKHLNITFHESILGCKKDINIKRWIQCIACHATGNIIMNDSCSHCKGTGVINSYSNTSSNFIFTSASTCRVCVGTGRRITSCSKCNNKGYISEDVDLSVKIPGGVANNSVIKLAGAGHMRSSMREPILIRLSVEPHNNMGLFEQNVISTLSISLKDAVKGTTKKVETVLGMKDLVIPSKSRNKDIVILPNHGVERKGDHLFMLDVIYPDNIIELLDKTGDTI